MKFIEDRGFLQRDGEPPRRFFTDNEFFDLFVWYRESEFANIAGFQLVYRANPFDTDQEFYISHYPDKAEEVSDQLGKTERQITPHAAHKLIKETTERPPVELFTRVLERLDSLPPEIQIYVRLHIEQLRS